MKLKITADANIPFVERCFSSLGTVRSCRAGQIDRKLVADTDILLVRSVTKVDSSLLEGSRVGFVGTATIGFEHVDLNFLERRGIAFASAPGSNANSVAEYVMAAMLSLAQKRGIELKASSIGIIGAGNVGGRVACKAQALGMKVLLNDPPLGRQRGDAKYLPLDALMACDFITLHVPLSFEGADRTYHFADGDFFRACSNRPFFINTSRGKVAETAALKEALASGGLRGAVLDVWENESRIDGELLSMVDIGTPHIAGYSLDGKVAGMLAIYRAVCEYLGVEPKYGAADFMPSEVARIQIPAGGTEQSRILEVVRRVYDIGADDRRLRGILELPPGMRGEFFESLRRDYPVRREFCGTRVLTGSNDAGLADRLRGLGFEV